MDYIKKLSTKMLEELITQWEQSGQSSPQFEEMKKELQSREGKKVGRPKSEYAKSINRIFSEGSERTKARRVVEMKAVTYISSIYIEKGLFKSRQEFLLSLPAKMYNEKTYDHQLFYFLGSFIIGNFHDEDVHYLFEQCIELKKINLKTKNIIKWLREETKTSLNKTALYKKYMRQIVSILEEAMVDDVICDDNFSDFLQEAQDTTRANQIKKAIKFIEDKNN